MVIFILRLLFNEIDWKWISAVGLFSPLYAAVADFVTVVIRFITPLPSTKLFCALIKEHKDRLGLFIEFAECEGTYVIKS